MNIEISLRQLGCKDKKLGGLEICLVRGKLVDNRSKQVEAKPIHKISNNVGFEVHLK